MPLVRNSQELGASIRRRRKEKRLTQSELAALTATSLRFITELERGQRTAAGLSKVLLVCHRLGLDVSIDAREGPP